MYILYLKSLELQGFKSFSKKTTLEFGPGVTCIVGPNGSGKSNISDAVRWVLGEQSAKNLRGSKMEDIIFAGTEDKRRVGFAQVSITIDNALKVLPIEFNEVTVTRRVYRSGESEYYINKSACRLRDIHELFMDTGLGKDGYSIIGQGRIDDILSIKSEDRRSVFEEAAGITKYKTRKIESEKNLELTQENLVRLKDIISELEKQLEPLLDQSEKAKIFLKNMDSLKMLEINISLNSIEKLKNNLQEIESIIKNLSYHLTENQKDSTELEKKIQDFYNIIKSNNNEISQYKDILYSKEGKIGQLQNEITILTNNIKNNENNSVKIINSIKDVDYKILNLKEILLKRSQELSNLNNKHYLVKKEIQEKEEEKINLLKSIQDKDNKVEKFKTKIIEKMNTKSNIKAKLNNYKTLEQNFNNREESISQGIQTNNQNIKNLNTLINNLRLNEKDIQTQIQTRKKDKESFDNKLLEKEKCKEKSTHYYNKYLSLFKEKISKKTLLEEMEKNYEGYYNSVRNILQEWERGSLKYINIHGTISKLINVPNKYTKAIEIALGSSLQNIVVENEEDAKKAIEYLKDKKLGRATFLPISSIKGLIMEDKGGEIANFPGFLGIGSQIISYDYKYQNIINRLLGRVIIVDNINSAVNMAKRFKYQFKIVTIEGEVLNPGGSITGGSINTSNRILNRQDEINQLNIEISNAKKYVDEFRNKLMQDEKDIEKLKTCIKENETKIIELESLHISIESDLKYNIVTYNNLNENNKELQAEQRQIQKQVNNFYNEQDKLQKNIEEVILEIKNIENLVNINQETYKKETILIEQINEDILNKKIYFNSLIKDIEVINTQIITINQELAGFKMDKDNKNIEKETLKNHNIDMYNQIIKKEEQIKYEQEETKLYKIEIEQKTNINTKKEEAIYEYKKDSKKRQDEISIFQQKLRNEENKKVRLELELENIINRLWDDYQHTYSSAKIYKKDIGSIKEAKEKILLLKEQIKELGNVNVGAIEEYKSVNERYEFLIKQKDDLEQAEHELVKVIDDIMRFMEVEFLKQFKIINKNFNLVFNDLFGGGKAEIKLSEPDNILESGIEIEVQPPGKKLQNLMLLSGGEKAFTAIALLFAFLKVRPTPFCIFDEIEAALDDINIYRFSQYIQNHSDKIQFILVTHRRGTMEAADVLYGITMQEKGISDLISLNLEEIEEVV